MRIMNYASEAPTMASGANIAAFNVGNALGAWLGGLTIAAGLGFTSPIWMGAAVTVAGLLVLIVAAKIDRPTASEQSAQTTSLHPTAV
jgi:DHA1 family inner membrane transport protein